MSDLAKISSASPSVIYVKPPTTSKEIADSLILILNKDIYEIEQFQLYHPLHEYLQQAFEKQLDMTVFSAENEALKQELDEFLVKHQGTLSDYVFMPINGRYRKATLVFTQQGEVVDTIYARLYQGSWV